MPEHADGSMLHLAGLKNKCEVKSWTQMNTIWYCSTTAFQSCCSLCGGTILGWPIETAWCAQLVNLRCCDRPIVLMAVVIVEQARHLAELGAGIASTKSISSSWSSALARRVHGGFAVFREVLNSPAATAISSTSRMSPK